MHLCPLAMYDTLTFVIFLKKSLKDNFFFQLNCTRSLWKVLQLWAMWLHMPERHCQHQSSLCVPQMLTTRWGLRMSYRQGNSNFFVLQLYYNIVNSLGVHIFASKKQINNICIWCVSGSIVGECSACKRCYLQPSWNKDLECSPSYTSVNWLQFYWKKQSSTDVTNASAKVLTLFK